jgi:hypothetical protein
VVSPDEPRNLGSKLHVWNDDPEEATESEIAEAIAPRLKVIAQKTWSSPPPAPSYEEFESLGTRLGRAPGYGPPSRSSALRRYQPASWRRSR